LAFWLTGIINQSHYFIKPDYPRIIANEIKDKLDKEDIIFTTNYKHILYYLLNIELPTKYVHPSLLELGRHITATGINPSEEIEKIMMKKPAFIIIEDDFYMYGSAQKFKEDYQLYRIYEKDIFVYRRNK
jgi:hypothetical protein